MDKKFVVTIGREFGVGGRQIAVELSQLLGVELYDKGLLKQLEERYDMSQEDIERYQQNRKAILGNRPSSFTSGMPTPYDNGIKWGGVNQWL